MKKYLVMILSTLMFIAFTAGAFAADKTTVKENPCANSKNCGMEGITKVTGTLKSIDKKKREMVITGEDGKDTTFKIKDLKTKKFKDGDKVEVTCVKKGEDCYAQKMKKVEAKK